MKRMRLQRSDVLFAREGGGEHVQVMLVSATKIREGRNRRGGGKSKCAACQREEREENQGAAHS